MANEVYVKGLAELRRDLRRTDKEALKGVQAATRAAAKIVAGEAGRIAPRQTGELAAGYKGTTKGNRGIVYSTVPYAPVFEWGGTIAPRGAPISIRAEQPIGRALAAKQDEIIEAIGDGIEAAAGRTGWR